MLKKTDPISGKTINLVIENKETWNKLKQFYV